MPENSPKQGGSWGKMPAAPSPPTSAPLWVSPWPIASVSRRARSPRDTCQGTAGQRMDRGALENIQPMWCPRTAGVCLGWGPAGFAEGRPPIWRGLSDARPPACQTSTLASPVWIEKRRQPESKVIPGRVSQHSFSKKHVIILGKQKKALSRTQQDKTQGFVP